MKLFSQTFLFCFFVILSLVFLDSILAAKFRRIGNALNDSGTLDGEFQKQDIRSFDAMLLFDGNEHGTEVGEDVILSRTGPINLTLTHETLEFEVCKSCMGTSTVCYEASRGMEVSEAVGDCRVSSSCEFKVNGEDQRIFFGLAPVLKAQFTSTCSSTTKMEYPFAHFLSDFINFKSCEPKMDDNKMIKLYVNIKEGCSIKVKGAKIHVPKISTTPLPLPERPGTSQKDSAEASSFPDWGYIIIGIAVLIAIAAIIGFIVYYLYKKHQTSKRALQKPDGTKPKATVSKADIAADVKTPTKKNDDLEAAKVEQTQMPKKEKKPKTLEPTTAEDLPENKKKTKMLEPKTTEDAPAPTVSKQEPPTPASKEPAPTSKEPAPTSKEPAPTSKEPAPTEHKPTPTSPTACYPQVKRLIPRGMKSAKSDSLDGTLKKDKRAMVDSFIVSAENLCQRTDASEIFDEVKADYPDIQHEVLASEITLLCLPVSLMFAEMNRLVNASMRKLFAVGCKFGAHIRLVSVTDEARQFLKDAKTDATTVYFAFGAEYYRLISDDSEYMDKASIPLLYVIALQPRFPEASRRKACALLRRKLVKVLGYYKAADRAKMPFPINIVEHAYCRDPTYFYNPADIKTDSGSEGKKKRIADGKRKKKSSKKR